MIPGGEQGWAFCRSTVMLAPMKVLRVGRIRAVVGSHPDGLMTHCLKKMAPDQPSLSYRYCLELEILKVQTLSKRRIYDRKYQPESPRSFSSLCRCKMNRFQWVSHFLWREAGESATSWFGVY